MELEIKYLEILVERTSYINTYWNFYIAVATGIIGIVASGKVQITKKIRIILTIAFLLFAISNLHSICDIIDQRTSLIALIKGTLSSVAQTLKPQNVFVYIIFHLLLDTVVVAAIWRINPHEQEPDKGKTSVS